MALAPLRCKDGPGGRCAARGLPIAGYHARHDRRKRPLERAVVTRAVGRRQNPRRNASPPLNSTQSGVSIGIR
jgi:hypothetical protein